MHDAKGRELKIGDRILIPAIITELSPQPDYCNVAVETVLGRKPDGMKERFSAFNTAVVLRANEGDDVSMPEDVVQEPEPPAAAEQEPVEQPAEG